MINGVLPSTETTPRTGSFPVRTTEIGASCGGRIARGHGAMDHAISRLTHLPDHVELLRRDRLNGESGVFHKHHAGERSHRLDVPKRYL